MFTQHNLQNHFFITSVRLPTLFCYYISFSYLSPFISFSFLNFQISSFLLDSCLIHNLLTHFIFILRALKIILPAQYFNTFFPLRAFDVHLSQWEKKMSHWLWFGSSGYKRCAHAWTHNEWKVPTCTACLRRLLSHTVSRISGGMMAVLVDTPRE